MTQPTSQEVKHDAILAAIPWRCFQCDFITSDPAEAQAHFGDRDDAEEFKPICKWWASISADERLAQFQQALKDLEAERRQNDSARVAIEGLTYQVDGIPSAIKSYAPFRGCNSIYDVFCVYDSMEGRAAVCEDLRKQRDEMLSALKALMVAYGASDGRNGNSGECWDLARAAILKAQG